MDHSVNDDLHEFAPRILANQVTAVLLLDEALEIRYINPAAEMLFSVSQRAITGQPVGQLLKCAAGLLESHLQVILDNHQPVTEREVAVELADGRTITVDCTLIPVAEEDRPTMVLMELRQVDRQLRLTREEQLISQNSAMRSLLRGLAHEIKNPLGGLRGAAQLLAMETEEESLREYTEIIIKEVDRLGALVDDMLGSRKLPVKQPVNVHHLLERVASIIESDPDNDIELERDYDPSIPELNGDPDQLIQALLNIVRNAVQATEGKGRVLLQTRVLRQFTLASRRYRLVVQINVEDSGPGIPEELQQAVFYPMVTGKAEGTGLGLSIAQSLINRHGGLIEFTSQPGRTVFTLYLPLELEQ
jgi:two-component system nitrogen regulation sensor histidine kinase GlnL